MIHAQRVTPNVHREVRIFPINSQFGDIFDSSLNVDVYQEYILVSMMNGELSSPLEQIKLLLCKLDFYRRFYDLPVLAQRKSGTLPGFRRLCRDFWIMKEF